MNDGFLGVSHRLPPSNMEAEQRMLGALLANNKAYDRIVDVGLLPEHFADPINGKIFAVASRIIEDGGLADAVMLNSKFSEDGILHEVGGTAYLTQLLSALVGVLPAYEYAKVIKDTWLRRQMIDVGEETVNASFHPDPDFSAEDILLTAEERLSDLAIRGSGRKGGTSILDAAKAAVHEGEVALAARLELEKRLTKGESLDDLPKSTTVSTGMPSLDKAILKLKPGCLYVVGGRPGVGKTGLARTFALNVALGMGVSPDGEILNNQKLGRGVAYFALEEMDVDFGSAAIAQLSGVPINVVTDGTYTEKQTAAISKATARLAECGDGLKIFDESGQSLRAIGLQCRALQRQMKGDLRLVVVDYLQLMANVPGLDKRLSVSHNAQGLKNLAKDLGCAVVVLSQLNRDVDNRADHRPSMSDLQESSGIEAAADVVALPYREAYYYERTRPQLQPGQSPDAHQEAVAAWQSHLDLLLPTAEIIIPKVRRGRQNVTVNLRFLAERVRFEEAGR